MSYKDLIVWQKSMNLVKEIYELTDKFPLEEKYGLSSQMQRAAVSIPSNIAEGYMRRNKKEYTQFLHISLGSAAELETQILIAQSLSKLRNQEYTSVTSLITEIMKMLYSLIKKIQE